MDTIHANTETQKPAGTVARRVLIIGAGAAGATAAARLRRLDERAEITILEKTPDVSVASCGMPYFIGGEIKDRAEMALHTPDSLGKILGLRVVAGTEAVALDRTAKTVRARDTATRAETVFAYDKLILATGATPLRPDLPGVNDPRILTLRTLRDMDDIRARATDAKQVVVVGAGFIGVEMAEQLRHGGREVTVVEFAPQVLPPLDADMAAPVRSALEDAGVRTLVNEAVTGFEPAGDGALAVKLRSGGTLAADLVILAAGVRPDTKIAADAGLILGKRGHLAVDKHLRTNDPDIYAAGDSVELFDRQTGEAMALPMGGPANRQGRHIADHIIFPDTARPYPGHLGTAIVRVFGLVAAVTGISEKRMKAANKPYRVTLVHGYNHASYYPGATHVSLKLIWDPETRRVLGAQALGGDGVDKRIDIVATAIAAGMTVDDLADLELTYAPPFGSARDIVNTAGFQAQNELRGLVRPVRELPGPGATLLDVRPAEAAKLSPVPGALNIPLPQLRSRLGELDRTKPVTTVCAIGRTGYFAARILAQNGFTELTNYAGGAKTFRARNPLPAPAPVEPAAARPKDSCHTAAGGCGANAPEAITVDACGLSCPGPLLKVKEAADRLAPGQRLVARAGDGGFARDIAAFCASNDLLVESVSQDKGVTTARILKPLASATDTPSVAGARRKGASVVVFSGDWDKVMAALVIANGAAAMGGQVTMFFTFWGLNALRKEQAAAVSGKPLLDRMFGFMMPRGLGRLGMSKMNMAGIGNPMFTWRMKQLGLPNPHGLMDAAQRAGVRIVACSMAMEAMGIRREELLDGVEVGGVADYLGAAETAGTNLFV